MNPLTYFEWTNCNTTLLLTLSSLSLAILLLSAISVPYLISRLPSDYFVRKERPELKRSGAYFLLLVLKNILGVLLLAGGLLMLILPGQGILTILAALMLVDFPGKFALERWLVSYQPVWHSLNWIRKRTHKDTFIKPQ